MLLDLSGLDQKTSAVFEQPHLNLTVAIMEARLVGVELQPPLDGRRRLAPIFEFFECDGKPASHDPGLSIANWRGPSAPAPGERTHEHRLHHFEKHTIALDTCTYTQAP